MSYDWDIISNSLASSRSLGSRTQFDRLSGGWWQWLEIVDDLEIHLTAFGREVVQNMTTMGQENLAIGAQADDLRLAWSHLHNRATALAKTSSYGYVSFLKRLIKDRQDLISKWRTDLMWTAVAKLDEEDSTLGQKIRLQEQRLRDQLKDLSEGLY